MKESKRIRLVKDLKEDGYKIIKHNNILTVLKKDKVTIKLK